MTMKMKIISIEDIRNDSTQGEESSEVEKRGDSENKEK